VIIEMVTPAVTPSAFEAWVRPHLAAMARLASRLAPGADRDDVVQEALTRAWLKRHQYDDSRGSPSAWLLAITADQARKAANRGARRLFFFRPDADRGAPPEDLVDLHRALRRLTRRQRLAIDCVYFVGLSLAETAAIMGCAEGTVKSTLADARGKLRNLLEVADDRFR
jgi:RNA polymerase sigma factor (sigma-70 family)